MKCGGAGVREAKSIANKFLLGYESIPAVETHILQP